MKKDRKEDTMRDEYDFRDARRGMHHQQYKEGTNVRRLAPELITEFQDDEAVNEALREYLRIKRKST